MLLYLIKSNLERVLFPDLVDFLPEILITCLPHPFELSLLFGGLLLSLPFQLLFQHTVLFSDPLTIFSLSLSHDLFFLSSDLLSD